MGIAASSSPPPPPDAAASAPPTPPPEAAAPADPPAKEDPQHSATAAAGAAAAAADSGGGGADDAAETVVVDASAVAGEEGEGEEEGECGFCLFMKGGGCKEEFVGWEKCVEEAEAAGGGDVVERCHEATALLRKCMDAHADYYEPILRVERAMAEDLEAAQARDAASETSPSSSPPEAPASEEKGQKEQVAVAAVHEKESGDPAA
ncbi:uncharacterized protein LOC133914230 [Phragmites australis]|uniref:uncharacterized protein LOC133914230 n=1 Tax=Phragmites australis TaxID=29695 RepID=UPI002D79580A|nr:uncharacterized protein LOC133914230 [Phragmites australis]